MSQKNNKCYVVATPIVEYMNSKIDFCKAKIKINKVRNWYVIK